MDLHFIIVMDGVRGVEMGGSRGEKKNKDKGRNMGRNS